MEKRKSKILALVCMFVFAASLQAETITIFDSNGTISGGDSYDTIVVKGDGTVVDMTGGDVNTVITMETATFSVSGGNIRWNVRSYDSSTVNLSTGSLSEIYSFGESRINIYGDVSIGYGMYLYNSAVATISSHDAAINEVYCTGRSVLNLFAGTVSYIDAYRNSTVNMSGGNVTYYIGARGEGRRRINISGGTVSDLEIYGSSITRLSGGAISSISSGESDCGVEFDVEIGVIGYDLSAVPYYGSQSEAGQITGFWNNAINFSIDLYEMWTYPYVVLYDGVIPPECVRRPESDLSGDCMVNFVDFAKMAGEWLDCGLDPDEASE